MAEDGHAGVEELAQAGAIRYLLGLGDCSSSKGEGGDENFRGVLKIQSGLGHVREDGLGCGRWVSWHSGIA